MHKHELLELVSIEKEITIPQALPQSNSSYMALYFLFRRATEQGLIQAVKKDGNRKVYKLTQKGKHRLIFFDEMGCGKKDCLICSGL